MMRSLAVLVLTLAVALALGGSPADADGVATEFIPIGDLPGGIFRSQANAISGDGLVVVGESQSSDGTEAFRWTRAGGMAGLGDLAGGSFSSHAQGVDGDGGAIVGSGQSTASAPIGQEAFLWTATGGMEPLGDLPGGLYASSASGCSAGGAVVAGHSSSGASLFNAMSWTEATGMRDLGDLAGGVFYSVANAVSSDGNTIVGQGKSGEGTFGVRWVEGSIESLGALTGDSPISNALDCSPDGTWIVGLSNFEGGTQAVLWHPDLTIEGLGNLPGGVAMSTARGVSADGTVVVGDGSTDAGARVFVWTPGDGMRLLTDVLSDLGVSVPAGWQLNVATGVSDDGRVICGYGMNPSGDQEGWVAVLGDAPVVEATGLLVTRVKTKINGKKPEKSRFQLTGQLDLGTSPDLDLTRPVTITAGGLEVTTGKLAASANGRAYGWSDGTSKFLLAPSRAGSSAAKFKFDHKSDLTELVPLEGNLDVGLEAGWGMAEGTVRVEKGAYLWNGRPGPGALVAPVSLPVSMTAKLDANGAKLLKLVSCLGPGGQAPAQAPDVTIEVGDFQATVPGASFTPDPAGFRFQGDLDGVKALLLDYTKKEALTLKAKGVDLGALAEGANAVTIRIDVGGAEREAKVRVFRKGRKVTY